jgi:hypothetical protein
MKYWVFGAFLICSSAYAGDTLFATYDLSGTVSAVSAPAEQLFAVGQRVSGDIQIFTPLTGCNVLPSGGCEVEESAGYSLKVGSVTFSGAIAEFPSELPILILRANNGTSALEVLAQQPIVSPASQTAFSDLAITLDDPTGRGFQAGASTFDPGLFKHGVAEFSDSTPGAFPDVVVATLTATLVRPTGVPEPGTLSLLMIGLLGTLWAWHRTRPKRSPATSIFRILQRIFPSKNNHSLCSS